MAIKQRTALVISISSAVIIAALALTVSGFYAYLGWKEKDVRRNYRMALYDLNARLFEKYVLVNMEAKIGESGVYKDRAILEGTVKNNSGKKIYSLKIKITFSDRNGEVVYVDTIYPAGLGAKNSASFTYVLRNCPKTLTDYLKSKLKFAKTESVEPLSLVYKVEGLDIR